MASKARSATVEKEQHMRSAIVREFHRPLELQDSPSPRPGRGEVLVRVEACGLCHTDIHAANGDWPVKPTLPFTPGHEGVGIVEELGVDVATPRLGDRVAVPWLGWACGTCEWCVGGWETLCPHQQNTGYSRDGSYADLVIASASHVVRVPDGVDPLDAAPLTCAGVTTYKAVKVADVRPTDIVAVFGVGGLGHLAVQYAHIAGGVVVAIDVRDEKLEMARELGATYTVNATREDPVAFLRELGGADAAIVTAVTPKPFRQAFDGLRRGGNLVMVGLPAENSIDIPIFETVLQGITVTGSIVGTRLDLAEVFELHAQGRTKVVRVTRRLDDVNEAMRAVEAGEIDARVVFDLRDPVAVSDRHLGARTGRDVTYPPDQPAASSSGSMTPSSFGE
jgi:alcohol dehydrogenase, propanol-preferring